MSGLTSDVKKQALAEGFDAVGICGPNDISGAGARLIDFINAGYHGQMAWMADRLSWRSNPAALWPEAKSIIMLAENYGPEHEPLHILDRTDCGAISVYAQNRDYHDIVKKRLKRLGRWMIARVPDAQIKVFVDTAPVMEKPLAQAAGLGWQGKHTNLLSRDLGNWFFLGAIFTNAELERDEPEQDHCGKCRKCLEICPTNAFTGAYKLDPKRCISYLTIEHDGPVDPSLRPLLGNRIYGCDDCLAVCPWNKFAKSASEVSYHARQELREPLLADLLKLDDAAFRAHFSKSPIKRIGRNRFIRNVLYAAGNSGDAPHLKDIAVLKEDADATVRDAATWAEAQISGAAK